MFTIYKIHSAKKLDPDSKVTPFIIPQISLTISLVFYGISMWFFEYFDV